MALPLPGCAKCNLIPVHPNEAACGQALGNLAGMSGSPQGAVQINAIGLHSKRLQALGKEH